MNARFARLCRNLVHALAEMERWKARGDSEYQVRYWRGVARGYRAQLQQMCDEWGIKLVIAVEQWMFDEDD